MLVGQIENRQLIDKWISNDSFPRFLIISGPRGSGKKTLSKYISQKLNIFLAEIGTNIEDIRNAINLAYSATESYIMLLPDIQNATNAAQNALLKLLEEPPNNVYFIITVDTNQNILGTLISRGTLINMQSYSVSDLQYFTKDRRLIDNCDTPGMIQELLNTDYNAFLDFCENVSDNIDKVTGGNALKISNYLNSKTNEKGYDPIYFIKVVTIMLIKKHPSLRIVYEISTTSQTCLMALMNKSMNNEIAVCTWILDIRKVLYEISL